MSIDERDGLRFEWNERKNISNQKKHKVSFEEASTVFLDEDGILIPDPDHSILEERFVLTGMSQKASLLTVVHCLREAETIIRIISARRASKNESRQYYERKSKLDERRI
ncbi:MAG: BrnT family toxin [Erysipelotrichaceae bacterium]|nr:BrnT family toxin [Erysipelotrichaceae bacterium]